MQGRRPVKIQTAGKDICLFSCGLREFARTLPGTRIACPPVVARGRDGLLYFGEQSYSSRSREVSHRFGSPLSRPLRNQPARSRAEPCVKDSGAT
jgi:hypothetical protein